MFYLLKKPGTRSAVQYIREVNFGHRVGHYNGCVKFKRNNRSYCL
jgi:hypothetical protein